MIIRKILLPMSGTLLSTVSLALKSQEHALRQNLQYSWLQEGFHQKLCAWTVFLNTIQVQGHP